MKTFSTDNSSRIVSLSWGDSVLRVEFKRGGVYEYYGVPEEVYESLIQAKSLGSSFDGLVKGKYPYQKLV